MISIDLDHFVSELDAAEQAHLEWTRRVLRCAVLHSSPGDDVLREDAHLLCRFGGWIEHNRAAFESMDAERTHDLHEAHKTMHAAIRAICSRVLQGKPGNIGDLETFETTQRQLIDNLSYFKTLAISRRSQVDPLTGLPLRHRMEQDFDLINKHILRHDSRQMVMMVDADHFKAVNDQHGHAAGDIVLQALATTLKRVLRNDDLIYRYGGEEFVLLMEISSEPGAETHAAGRVLESVRALSIPLPEGATVHPTVTIGVALAEDHETLGNVIQRADAALYAGKAAGRNRFMLAADLPEGPPGNV